MQKPFDVLRWFSLLSFACIALIGVAIALIVSQYMAERIISHDAEVSRDFIESMVLAEENLSYFAEPGNGEARTAFESYLENLARMNNITRVNVYARERTITWSSYEAFIGQKATANPELDRSFSGDLISGLGVTGPEDKPEHVDFDPAVDREEIIEIYVPVFNRERTDVLGVIEIYKVTETLLATVERGRRLVWISVAASGLVLYLVLFAIVNRAHSTIRKQQDMLVESETMAAIGEMASTVAHGIRNPLSAIRSSAELTLKDSSETAREAASDIIAESDRLDKWLRELLLYVGPSCAPASQRVESANVDDVVSKQLRSLSSTIERYGVEVTVDIDTGLPGARIDAAILGQVFTTLVINALEAMKGRETKNLKIRSWADQSRRMIFVTVADTGPGISKEALNTLFTPSASTKRGGLGLGLALSKRIITRYGGSLHVESAEGRETTGTKGTIRLPATL